MNIFRTTQPEPCTSPRQHIELRRLRTGKKLYTEQAHLNLELKNLPPNKWTARHSLSGLREAEELKRLEAKENVGEMYSQPTVAFGTSFR
jgi:hypothetical protein